MEYNEKEDFSHFGKSFQENMCQLILLDRPFADQIKEVLDIEFLELSYLRVFAKKIFDYKDKYKAPLESSGSGLSTDDSSAHRSNCGE